MYKFIHLGDISERKDLSAEQQCKRFKNIKNVEYKLALAFKKSKKSFEGVVQIEFHLENLSEDVILDFDGQNVIMMLVVNDNLV